MCAAHRWTAAAWAAQSRLLRAAQFQLGEFRQLLLLLLGMEGFHVVCLQSWRAPLRGWWSTAESARCGVSTPGLSARTMPSTEGSC